MDAFAINWLPYTDIHRKRLVKTVSMGFSCYSDCISNCHNVKFIRDTLRLTSSI